MPTTTENVLLRALRQQTLGRSRLVRLDDLRNRHRPRAALATHGKNGRITLLPEPRDGDMYAAARFVVGDSWGDIAGPVAVWGACEPALMSAFIGPPVAIIYLEG